jgi:hypothetical protein
VYLNYCGVPFFTLVCGVYVYWDEFCKKINFLLLDRKIKDYKKLKLNVQKLVPEIVRKSQLKQDHTSEISR